MACCAFAIFLLSQLFAPFRALARRLGIAREWRPDEAVEWRPGATSSGRKSQQWKRIIAAFVVFDLAALGLVGAATAATADAVKAARSENTFEQIIHKSICGSFGWRD